MRKVEIDMLNAIENRKDWSNGNTSVDIVRAGNPYGDRAEIYLFGHHIADVWYTDTASLFHDEKEIDGHLHESRNHVITVNRRTLADFPTVTTRSRLNALGSIRVSQAKKKCYLNGEFIADVD